jgi:hypothetical protein
LELAVGWVLLERAFQSVRATGLLREMWVWASGKQLAKE